MTEFFLKINHMNQRWYAAAHYETTGPEIWEQTEGKITHWAAGVGTGGSMCGTAKFLKEQNPNIISVGIDSYGSVFKKYKETGIFDENEIYPYMTEGIGEDILPKNVDFDLIDTFVKVTDKDAAIMTRKLAREEGLFIGWSCGSAVFGALEYARENLIEDDTMVIILPDHGTRYLGKLYNDNWMKDHGFIEAREYESAKDIIDRKNGSNDLFVVNHDLTVGEAIKTLTSQGIDQIPVVDGEDIVGSMSTATVLNQIINKPEIKNERVESIMDAPMPFVAMDNTLDVLSSMINKSNRAVLVRDLAHKVHIITHHDILQAMSN